MGLNLWKASLRGTNFIEAFLSGAFLEEAQLHGSLSFLEHGYMGLLFAERT